MRAALITGAIGLGMVGLTACAVADAEPVPTTTVAEAVTTVTLPEPTTTVPLPATTLPEPAPVTTTSVQPTTTARPVTPTVPEPTPTTVYYEPVYEAPEVQYEPMGTNAFLECVKQRESRGDYTAANPSSGAGGAYQFLQNTWNNTANYAGRPDLVGVHPSQASPYDQDQMAIALYNWQGPSPWAGPGCG